MINRESELQQIDDYLKTHNVRKGPTAFVSPSVQADVPEQTFTRSDVKNKNVFWAKKGKGGRRRRIVRQ